MKRKIFIAAAVVIFSNQLLAQRLTQDTASKILDEVIVTATKSPIKQSETGKVVNVITQQQLKRSTGKTLS